VNMRIVCLPAYSKHVVRATTVALLVYAASFWWGNAEQARSQL